MAKKEIFECGESIPTSFTLLSAGAVDYTAGDEVRPSMEGFCQ